MKRGLHKDKTAQFYLLAAIVIIALIIGFAAITNYSKKKENIKLVDLGEELGIEGGEVLDYGVYSGEEELPDFAGKFSDYAGEGKNLYFIFGNEDGVTLVTYEDIERGEISFGGSIVSINQRTAKRNNLEVGDEINLVINGLNYNFKLNPGENFYFVIFQEAEGEKHVVQG